MLEVIGISRNVQDEVILASVSLTVPTGTTVGVLGPSGSGKTSLLRAIAALDPIDTGDIRWDGTSLAGVPTHRRGFGLMFQDLALFPHRSVGDNVGFGLEVSGVPEPERRLLVSESLELVGLAGFGHRSIETLSGGEQQRVALARALAPKPRMLMFDEPLGSLDRGLREHLVGEIRQILHDNHMTAIYVSHDQDEAFSVADHVVLLHEGRVAGEGSPEQLWTDPGTEWVARFLGFANVVDIRNGRWGKARFPDVPDGPAFIRRQAIHLDPFGPVSGTVVSSVFSAGHFLLEVDTPDGMLEVESDTRTAPATPVRVTVDPGGAVPLSRKPPG